MVWGGLSFDDPPAPHQHQHQHQPLAKREDAAGAWKFLLRRTYSRLGSMLCMCVKRGASLLSCSGCIAALALHAAATCGMTT